MLYSQRPMTGYAPVNAAYIYADRFLAPESMVRAITRCKYATLACMARNGGDLALREVAPRQRARMTDLARSGLVRFVSPLKRYELTAQGWRVLNGAEAAYYLALEAD